MSRFPDGPYKGRRAERAGAPQQPSAPSLAAPSQTAAYNAPPERRIADLEQEIIALKNQMALYNNSLYVDSTPPADKEVRVWRSASGKWLNQALPFGVDAPGNWKLFYSDGSGVVTELAVGADGTVLTSTGTSAAPAFETLGAGMKPLVTISPASVISVGVDLAVFQPAAPTSQTPLNGVTVYVPFALSESITIDRVGWEGTSGGGNTGNIDIGVINEAGARQFSTGSTSLGADGADVTNTVLAAGRYYMAIATEITAGSPSLVAWTVTAFQGRTMGLAQQATFPIPTNATLASFAQLLIPAITLSTRTFF